MEAAHTPKYVQLEPASTPPTTSTTMTCYLPTHAPLTFRTYSDYEIHYTTSHTNRCTTCCANLPSPHFLSLHITENHDPIAAAKRERGDKIFACFVEDCDKICAEWKKRRSHLVDKHGYPRNYDFFVVNTGIDGMRSILRAGVDREGHRRSSQERGRSGSEVMMGMWVTDATSVSAGRGEMEGGAVKAGSSRANANPAVDMDKLTNSMSSLKMVPRSVAVGKRGGPLGFAKS